MKLLELTQRLIATLKGQLRGIREYMIVLVTCLNEKTTSHLFSIKVLRLSGRYT